MSIRIVRLGEPRVPEEGVRLGTVRSREDRRHRSVLRELLVEQGAEVR